MSHVKLKPNPRGAPRADQERVDIHPAQLRALLAEAGLGATKVAAALGLGRSTIADWMYGKQGEPERPRNRPSKLHYRRLCQFLGECGLRGVDRKLRAR